MPTPYDTTQLQALMSDDEAVTGYRDQIAKAVARMQRDSLDPVNNGLELHHHVGGLGRVLASSWAIEAMRAWQEIHVAMAVGLWRIPRAAAAKALGLAGATNFRTQFPQLEEIMETFRREINTGREIELTVRGFHFVLGPMWHGVNPGEQNQEGND